MDLWLPQIPADAGDAAGFLVFALSWCVQRRARAREQWLRDQSDFMGRIRAAKIREGRELTPIEKENPNPYAAMLLGLGEFGGHTDPEVLRISRENRRQRCVVGIASWLFMFLHGGFPSRRNPDSSAVARLRCTARSWRDRLPNFSCCDCGRQLPPGQFCIDWTFCRFGDYGQLPCRHCEAFCTDHLACEDCKRAADSDSWDSEHDC